MTPAELREKVARAMREHRERPADELASLAIYVVREAMREPSVQMRQAFHVANEEYEDGSVYPESSPDYQWRAMLAASPLREE